MFGWLKRKKSPPKNLKEYHQRRKRLDGAAEELKKKVSMLEQTIRELRHG